MRKGLVRLFLAILLLLAGSAVKAAPVSEDSARTVAAHVLGVDTSQLVNRTAELPSAVAQYIYMFSPEGGVGFALISADDCALPVLGYSTTTTYYSVYGFNEWLVDSKNQIASIRSQGLAASARVAALWTQLMDGGPVSTGTPVAPMLTTTWGQDATYRRFSPKASSGYGCHPGQIALSMAQIMKYWNYPPRGQGSYSYTNSGDPAVGVAADFNTAYDWANMPDALTSGSTDAEKDAVNQIIFHAAVSIRTTFRVNNSTMGNAIYQGFLNYFRYRSTINTKNTGNFTSAAYDELMMAELAAGRPFIYRKGNVEYCFVVDGCDAWGQYHVNWGWSGRNDGYFALGSLNPGVYTYPYAITSVMGIEPQTVYTVSAESNNDEWGSVSGGGSYVVGDRVTLEAMPVFGSRFLRWSDGSTVSPLVFNASEDRNITAIFEWLGMVDIQVEPNNASWGSVSGGGSYVVGDRVVLKATATPGYRFDRWNDGNTENPRRFPASENRTDTAIFVYVGTATINGVSHNAARGRVDGGGIYSIGDSATLTARPASGWIFERWDDGNTENPRRFLATGNLSYTAYFVRPGVGDPQFHLVELDDRESHSWSYYSDSTCLVRSLNPADVRIRYFGYGENTMYSSGALVPEGAPDVDVSNYMVGIGIDAPWKNTYVYHKTLERVNGEQAESVAAADGPCFYQLIPNPYSRRPTHGTGDTRWRGFYKWRLKTLTGGAVFRDLAMTQSVAVGAMLDAEDTLFLMPAAEYGMEVDFEAIWARAFVFSESTPDGGINDPSLTTTEYARGTNAYERNFVILTANGNFTVMPNHPSTVSAVYPDGTNGTNNILLTARPTSVTLQHTTTDDFHADTKFEYLVIRSLNKPGEASQVHGNYVIFGRGLKNADGTPVMRRLCDTWDISQYNSSHLTKYRLESGDYDTVLLLGYNTRYIDLVYAKAAMGSDYDRSLCDNSQLYVFSVYGSHGCRFEDPRTDNIELFRHVVKSGSYGMIYVGVGFSWSFSTKLEGTRSIVIEGGSIDELAGGKDTDVQYGDSTRTKCRIRIHEGQYNGPVYGAASQVGSHGHRRMVITGGKISGWLAGGVNGKISFAQMQQWGAGLLRGNSYIYFGGKAHIRHTAADPKYNHSHGGNIFGAGSGHPDDTSSTTPTGRVNNSTIVIADSAYVSRNVYGGGNYGYIADTGSRIQILGGTVAGKVFGGSNRQRGRQVDILMRDGQVVGGIHGGSNVLGAVAGPVTVCVEGGTVGTPGCADTLGNVFGCGYGERTSVTGDVEVIIGSKDAKRPHVDNPLIHGNVYCGGFMGAYSSTNHTFKLTTYNGRIKRNVFGGGYGTSAVITGNTNVNIFGTTHVEGNVYGGGNMGKITGNTHVVIGDDTNTYTLTVTSNDVSMGTVSGGGTYPAFTDVRITATPASGHCFKRWSDGNTSNPRSITVRGDATYTAEFEESVIGWVDLGLPSGLLWAEVNLGADQPSDYGDYYAWAETTPNKSSYSNATTAYYSGSAYTKYNSTDGLTTLQPEDDIATITFGANARIPTMADWQEFLNNTTVTTESLNGVNGRRFTSKNNGNSIFVPFTGYRNGTGTSGAGSNTCFWSSTLSTSTNNNAVDVYITTSSANFYSGSNGESRHYGFPIRAVRRKN